MKRNTFQKGNPGKPKGATNKTTDKVKAAFAMLLENNLEKLQEDLDKLKPIERINFLKDLSEYIIPKLARVDSTIDATLNKPFAGVPRFEWAKDITEEERERIINGEQ